MENAILYRWDSQNAGIPDPIRSDKAKVLQEKIAQMFPDYASIIKVLPIKFPIKFDKTQVQITNADYLSSSMGVGGQILGFLTYSFGQEKKGFLNYTTFNSSQYAFRNDSHPNLFILTGTSIEKVKDKIYKIKTTDLDDRIKPCDGIVKFYPLGSLMDDAHRNNAEINFIGNGVNFDGFMIKFKDDSVKKQALEEDSSSEEESQSALPSLFIRRGGVKRLREELREVPIGFERILDDLSMSDKIGSIPFKEIDFDMCPPKGGRKKTKRSHKPRKSRNAVRTQKR